MLTFRSTRISWSLRRFRGDEASDFHVELFVAYCDDGVEQFFYVNVAEDSGAGFVFFEYDNHYSFAVFQVFVEFGKVACAFEFAEC